MSRNAERLAARMLDGGYSDTDEPLSDDDSSADFATTAEDRTDNRARATEQSEFHSYLHSFGAQYDQHRQALRAQREAEEAATLKGVPAISPYAAAKVRDEPIQERLFRMQAKREARLEKERAEAERERERRLLEETGGRIGKPRISPAAQAMRRDGSIAEQSARWIEQHKKNMQALQEDALKREMAELRPAPRIASASAMSNVDRGGLPVGEHLMLLEKDRQRRLYEEVERRNREARQDARPKLSKRSGSVGGKSAGSTLDSTVNRLYDPSFKIPAYDADFVEKCTFHPRIYSRVDPTDELMQLPVHERLLQRKAKQREATAKSIAEQRRSQDAATGRPQLSARSRRLAAEQSSASRQRLSAPSRTHEDGDQSPPHDPEGAAIRSEGTSMNASTRFGGSPTDRLYGDALKRREAMQERAMAARARSAPRGPKLSKKSREMNSHNPRIMQAGDPSGSASARARSFDARQRLFLKQQAEHKERLEREKAEREAEELQRECTFKPQMERTRDSTRPKGKARAEMADEPHMRRGPALSDKDFYQRNEQWMNARRKHLAAAEAAKSERELAECKFNPTIKHEVPAVTLSSQAARGAEEHIERMRAAQQEREIIEQGGWAAVQRREKLEAEAARHGGRRSTIATDFNFSLSANAEAVSASRKRGPSKNTSAPRHRTSFHHDGVASLRPPVTPRDLSKPRTDSRANGDDQANAEPAERFGHHHFYGQTHGPRDGHRQSHLPHEKSSFVGSAWASHGYAAPPELSPRGGTRETASSGGFFSGDSWGDPVSEQPAASDDWGSAPSSGAAAILRHSHETFRHAVAAASNRHPR